ncbi:MAG: outer membrane protein assembly factor BamB family protein [Pirellulales bacterium]
MSKTLLLSIVSLFLIGAQLSADNWGHWRGESGNGVSTEAKPPTEWSDTKNVKWKVVVPGRGSGSPVIWGDQVFVVTAVNEKGQSQPAARSQKPEGTRPPQGGRPQGSGGGRPSGVGGRPSGGRPGGGRPGGGRPGGGRPGSGGSSELSELQFKLLCFDRNTGELQWEQTVVTAKPHQGTHSTNGFASASPCTDGKHVYAHYGSRGLYCYTMDGKLVWKRDELGKMETRNSFGEGSSPTIEGDKIIVPWDHEGQSYVYALNKQTGKTLWKTQRDEPTCWATPLVVEHKGKKQVILNGQTCARGYDLETGKELWRCAGQTDRPAASPVASDGLVIVGSGFRGYYMGAFRLDGQGDIEDSKSVEWTLGQNTPDIASPLLSSGRVYFYKGKSGILSCVDAATGEAHYTAERIDGLSSIYASPIAAGGYVYLTGRSGTTVVIDDSSKLNVVSTNSVGETVDATPAPVGNQLFIRGEKHLFCIGE